MQEKWRCTGCQRTARPLDGRPQREVQVRPDKLEVVASFCYVGDMLSATDGCELTTTTCENCLEEVQGAATSSLFPLPLFQDTWPRVQLMWSAILHASETWPLTKPNLQRLQRNDRAMIRQICNVKIQDIVTTRSNELLVRLGIEDLDPYSEGEKYAWYGHEECSKGAAKTAFDIQVDGKYGSGRAKMTWKKMTWKKLTVRDCREWKLSSTDPLDRRTWRSGVRSAMLAASQLPGRGPLMWMLPLYLHVNLKSSDDDDDDDMYLMA